jgi:hypothetical protein
MSNESALKFIQDTELAMIGLFENIAFFKTLKLKVH